MSKNTGVYVKESEYICYALKLYLENSYKITNNIKDYKEFNVIYKQIIEDAKIQDLEFREIIYELLPLALINLGLEKKKFPTGIFWYGLIYKSKYTLSDENLSNMSYLKKIENDGLDNKINELIKNRKEQDKEFSRFQQSQVKLFVEQMHKREQMPEKYECSVCTCS